MKTQSTSVEIREFSIRQTMIPITSISPLIVNGWSEKAMRMITDKQAKKPQNKKHEIRDPQQDFENAKHRSPLGWEGFPAAGFKAAMIRASKILGMVMKDTQTAFFIIPDCQETQLVRIYGESRMRTDMVKIGMGASDIRYRPEYPEWHAQLNIEFNAGVLSVEQVYQLVKAAGYFCGLGEMRPERTKFNFGRFKLKNES